MHWSNALLGHATQPSYTWVEVARMDERVHLGGLQRKRHGHGREGADGYGCWFYAARGSGIFLELRRTAILHNGALSSSEAGLLRAPNPNGSNTAALRSRYLLDFAGTPREAWPHQALAHGFASVQNQFKHNGADAKDPFGEVVSLAPSCVAARLSNQSIGPELRTCPHALGLRTGWAHDRPCACDESKASLMCL